MGTGEVHFGKFLKNTCTKIIQVKNMKENDNLKENAKKWKKVTV